MLSAPRAASRLWTSNKLPLSPRTSKQVYIYTHTQTLAHTHAHHTHTYIRTHTRTHTSPSFEAFHDRRWISRRLLPMNTSPNSCISVDLAGSAARDRGLLSLARSKLPGMRAATKTILVKKNLCVKLTAKMCVVMCVCVCEREREREREKERERDEREKEEGEGRLRERERRREIE